MPQAHMLPKNQRTHRTLPRLKNQNSSVAQNCRCRVTRENAVKNVWVSKIAGTCRKQAMTVFSHQEGMCHSVSTACSESSMSRRRAFWFLGALRGTWCRRIGRWQKFTRVHRVPSPHHVLHAALVQSATAWCQCDKSPGNTRERSRRALPGRAPDPCGGDPRKVFQPAAGRHSQYPTTDGLLPPD